MESTNQELFAFIKESPTVFHTVDAMRKVLMDAGFEEVEERNHWELKRGGNYFVTRNNSSLIAFRMGEKLEEPYFHMVAAHTDSPCFKIKENAELHTAEKYTRLNTEGYGGMLCSTWLDKPLSIAGRVVVREADGSLAERLLDFARPMLLIPNVAIHMNRDANDGYKWNKQVDLMPLLSGGSKEGSWKELLQAELEREARDVVEQASRADAEQETGENGKQSSELLASDLFLYNMQEPTEWGASAEFISAPRLDDLQCLFGGLKALLDSKPAENEIALLACFDNEEVGSATKQGACSTFLQDCLKRVMLTLSEGEEAYYRALADSFMISADNAHAVHPNHPEHTDAGNCVYMNEGVVVKSHAGQKYTSDAVSIAYIKDLAQKAEVPLQYFANRSDKAGGSTLGNLAQGNVSVKTVDIGLAQLAMHSSYETAGAKDTEWMVKLLKEFYKG